MSELVASRRLRRSIPERGAWESVAWDPPSRPNEGRSGVRASWMVAGALLVVVSAAIWQGFQTEVDTNAQEVPVWLELPPPPMAQTVAPPPSPSPPVGVIRPPEPAPLPLAPVPETPANPDPAFGLDDAVETGGLDVAAGATLAEEPDPVVRPPQPPAGPVHVASVPASARPVVPVYPPRAEAAGIEAAVVALVTTDTTGNVVDFRVERSGGREFDQAVRTAVMATRFVVPRGPDGRARAVAFRLPYDFRLE